MTILDSRNIPRFHDRTGDLRARLKERDPRLWTEDAEVAEAIRNRLGWLDASAFSRAHLGEITAFARAIRAEGFRHVVLLGMGGSSLAPEVLAKCFGAAPGCPDLTVLDSTAPDAVRAAAQQCPPAHTVYLVSSKSGTTAETLAFHDYFRSLVQQQSPGAPGKHFAVITDPGSPLVTQGDTHDFRAVFLNPADIGGRFSALSYFGLVPAAAIGQRRPRAGDRDRAGRAGKAEPQQDDPAPRTRLGPAGRMDRAAGCREYRQVWMRYRPHREPTQA
jgi:glucose-6-phosphate isomerase